MYVDKIKDFEVITYLRIHYIKTVYCSQTTVHANFIHLYLGRCGLVYARVIERNLCIICIGSCTPGL